MAVSVAALAAAPVPAGPSLQTSDGGTHFTLIRPPAADQAARELEELRRICSYWTDRLHSDSSAATMRDAACGRMRDHANRFGLSAPGVDPPRAPRLTQRRRPPVSRPRYPLKLEACQRHNPGSIAWRDCRSRERERLHQNCLAYGSRAASAQGGAYLADMRGWQRAYCDAYARYETLTRH
ncbi:MAG: hypothetical protein LJE84_10590 [Gammaproteobacteria bacterium]|nr:hypothetical protein [Gammaproteobacteria bacterium]